jgi:hypothetical protein
MLEHALLEFYPMVHNLLGFNFDYVRLGLSENDVDYTYEMTAQNKMTYLHRNLTFFRMLQKIFAQ